MITNSPTPTGHIATLGFDIAPLTEADRLEAEIDRIRLDHAQHGRELRERLATGAIGNVDQLTEAIAEAVNAHNAGEFVTAHLHPLRRGVAEHAKAHLESLKEGLTARMTEIVASVNKGAHDDGELDAVVGLRDSLAHWWPSNSNPPEVARYLMAHHPGEAFAQLADVFAADGLPGLVAAGERVRLNSGPEVDACYLYAYQHPKAARVARRTDRDLAMADAWSRFTDKEAARTSPEPAA